MGRIKHSYCFTILKVMLLPLLACIFVITISSKQDADRSNLSASLIANAYSNTNIGNDVRAGLQKTNLEFIENRGQIIDTDGNLRPDIAYVADGNGAKLYFTSTGVSYVFTKIEKSETKNVSKFDPGFRRFERDELENSQVTTYRMDMKLLDSNPNVRIYAEEETEGYFNYYYAHCPDGILGVKSYKRLIYENIYDNVDLVYYDNEKGMEYDFVVKPGGNVQNIRFQYEGAEQVSLLKNGKLKIVNPLGQIIENAPKTFTCETYPGLKKTKVSNIQAKGCYRLHNNIITFDISNFNTDQILIIDPELSWATYYGGSNIDFGYGIATDTNGNVVITGETYSTNFPVINAFQTSSAGGSKDAFIMKFSSSGSRQWATYYGGSNADDGYSIATDTNGNVVITGYTASTDFPMFSAFQTSIAGNRDAFIIKFNGSGNRQWATYYGGSDGDFGYGIATDTNGNVVITGETWSTDFPVTSGAFQTSSASYIDAFIIKFNSSGSRMWATYCGGNANELSEGIATDTNGNVIITGLTGSTNFPVTSGAFQTSCAGYSDAFVIKFNSSGNIMWATYYGGSDDDRCHGIATDINGNVVITGDTKSTDFPVTSGAFQTSIAGSYDAFIIKFNSSGNRQWATYYGGSDDDFEYGIATDTNGNVVITGETASTDFPVTSGAFQTSIAGSYDAFIIKFTSSGNRQWATYYGGSDDDLGHGIATDTNGNVVITGWTGSTNFPVTSGAFQTSYAGNDAFIVKFLFNPLSTPTLFAPLNGANDISTNPTLKWNIVSGAISYRLQVSIYSDFSTTILDEGNITATSKTISGLSDGKKYYWRVNATGESITTDWSETWNFTTGTNWTLEHNVFFPSYGNPSDYRQTDYRIIGLPGASDVLMNLLFSGTQGKDWQVYRDNGNPSTNPKDYLVAYDGSSHFLLGNGNAFWMINKGPLDIDTSVDPPSMGDSKHTIIQLHEGWNLITNPFLTSISWSDVKQANSIVAPIWKYNGTSGFDSLTTIFEPYIGYYFDAPSDLDSLKIPSPYTLQKKSDLAEEDPALWRVRMILSCGEFRDRTASFGIAQNSSRDFDRLDFCKPRSTATSPTVFFYRPQWDHNYNTFATDIRPEFDEMESWDFEVRSVHQQNSRLDFTGIEQIPAPMEIYLVDEGRGKSVNLREQRSYDFTGIGDVMKFRVVVGQLAAVKDNLNEINILKKFALGNNYPNPFNPETTIPVEIPIGTFVELKIYNTLGQYVKSVFEGSIEAGRYLFTWDGRDETGNRLASGVYVLFLNASDGIALTHKMILIQ